MKKFSYNRKFRLNKGSTPTMLLSMATILTFGGISCTAGNSDGAERTLANDSIPKTVKEFVASVTDNDSVKFASIVSYPLTRPYPLPDIQSPEEMKRYFSLMVDDSLRNIIKSSGPERWNQEGWKGWTIDDGKYVWIDDAVYDFPYLSNGEAKRRQQLIKEEMESLYPSLREGWQPEACMQQKGDGSVYRIDRRTDADSSGKKNYRLMYYPSTASLDSLPGMTLMGDKETEGTALTVTYIFESPELTIYYEPESPESKAGESEITIVDKKKGEKFIPVKKAYWQRLKKNRSLK